MCPWRVVNATERLRFECALIYLTKLDRAVVGSFQGCLVDLGWGLILGIVIYPIRSPKRGFASFGMSKSLSLHTLESSLIPDPMAPLPPLHCSQSWIYLQGRRQPHLT